MVPVVMLVRALVMVWRWESAPSFGDGLEVESVFGGTSTGGGTGGGGGGAGVLVLVLMPLVAVIVKFCRMGWTLSSEVAFLVTCWGHLW